MIKENHRCSVCNSVNNPDIETTPGEYSGSKTYYPDPENTLFFLCSSCSDAIYEAHPKAPEEEGEVEYYLDTGEEYV